MRNTRFVVALVAVACAAALPAAAAAHNGKPEQKADSAKSQHGPDKARDGATLRLSPVTGQTATGAVHLKAHANALSISLIVGKLTPGAFYAAHLHAGSCGATAGAVALTFPDLYADERGVAKLVISLPTATAATFLAGGYSVDVHAGPSASATPVIACGDIAPKVTKAAAKAFLKGANHERGRAELIQKGSDVTVWVKLGGLTPGAHALQLLSGKCSLPGAAVVSLGDVTADADGTVFTKVAASSTIPVVGKGYALAVYTGASAAPGAAVACGDLWPVRWHGGHKV